MERYEKYIDFVNQKTQELGIEIEGNKVIRIMEEINL